MKLEQIGEHSYRYRKMIKGKLILLTFDHKPSDREITLRLAERIQDEGGKSGTFRHCIVDYKNKKKK